MKAALPADAAGKPVEIWFQDEARVGQKGSLTRVWAKRGSRPAAPRDNRYKWAYLFGAVCPDRATGAALVLPYANVDMMQLHLDEISRSVRNGAHAVVVLDGAGYHEKAAELEAPNNITLLTLPPYSPELNPVENVWEFLRQNWLAHLVFKDQNAIVDACCNAWNRFFNLPGAITSITQRNWAQVNI